MKAIFNHSIIQSEDLNFEQCYRAASYADGFFETMRFVNGSIPLWKYHANRLRRAGNIAGLLGLDEIIESFPFHMKNLCAENSAHSSMRCKLTIWRAGKGLYSPETDAANFLLTASLLETPMIRNIYRAGFCHDMFNTWHVLSKYKQIGAQNYVLAAREMKARALDDIIILDAQGNISEALYSNIFCVKDDCLYTPALQTGCVEGTMRSYLIDNLAIPVKEVLWPREAFLQSDSVFFSNALGICHLLEIEGKVLKRADWVENYLPFAH